MSSKAAATAVTMDDSVPLSHSAPPPDACAATTEKPPLKRSEKAYTILGTEAMPPKLQQRLGSLDRNAFIKARQEEQREREKDLKRVINQRPTAEQLKIPSNAEVPLAVKALDVFGSEELKKMSRNAVPNRTKIKNYAKLVALLGELDVTSDKAQQLLGSMDETDAAVRKADLELHRETNQRKKHQMKKVLSAPVSAQQLELPAAARARDIHEPVVSLKALELMGEEILNKAAREHVPDGFKVMPKAMTVLGEAQTLPAKARTVLGDLRNDMDARRRADEQLATEIRNAKEESDSSKEIGTTTSSNSVEEDQTAAVKKEVGQDPAKR